MSINDNHNDSKHIGNNDIDINNWRRLQPDALPQPEARDRPRGPRALLILFI